MNVITPGAKGVKRLNTTQEKRAMSSNSKKKQTIVVCTAISPFLMVNSVVNASLRNVRKNLDVGMIATVLQMPSSARLVLRVERRLKRRANKTKTTSPKIKITAAYVKVTAQRHHV